MRLSFIILFIGLLGILTYFTLIKHKELEIKVPKNQAIKTSDKNSKGQAIFEHYCINCHQEGVAGAPKVHDETDWKPHLANKTIDDLLISATNGLNNMPAQGTCYECTKEDLKAAIQYMLPSHDENER